MRLKSTFGGSGKLGGRQVWWAEQNPAPKKYIHDPTPRTCDCYLLWLKKTKKKTKTKLCQYNSVKDLEMERLVSLSRWTLTQLDWSLQRNVWLTEEKKAETSDVAISRGPPADTRSWKRQGFSPRTPWGREVRPCQYPNFSSVIVIFYFWPLELWENNILPPSHQVCVDLLQ